MTHADITKNFMIEYDKANVTSSYPSLTKMEMWTILDKAYLALISLKVSGANFRKALFQSDAKSIEDLRPLIKRSQLTRISEANATDNELKFSLPTDYMYFVSGRINGTKGIQVVQAMPHSMYSKFAMTSTNNPWIQNPALFFEDDHVVVLYDHQDGAYTFNLQLMYISKPTLFTEGKGLSEYTFELSDQMAEELINLAIIMSLEIVESSRLSTKLQTSALES